MFTVKVKVKDGLNTFPRRSSDASSSRRNSHSSNTNSLRSSMSRGKNPKDKKSKRVRIVTNRFIDEDGFGKIVGYSLLLSDHIVFAECLAVQTGFVLILSFVDPENSV